MASGFCVGAGAYGVGRDFGGLCAAAFEEATSAVDPETEVALVSALDRLSEGRTTISVAHRLSTAERADFILVFDEGAIVESGQHSELVNQEGIYASLFDSWLGNTRLKNN